MKGIQYYLKASKKSSIPHWLVAGFRLNDACKILASPSNCVMNACRVLPIVTGAGLVGVFGMGCVM